MGETGSGANLTKPGFPYPFLPVFPTIIRSFLSDPYVFLRALTAGIANIRNPVIVSVASKGLLPYHGLGSGIRRALAAWQKIEFVDDRDRNQFSAMVYRPPWNGQSVTESFVSEPQRYRTPGDELLNILRVQPSSSYDDLAGHLGVSVATVKRRIQRLKKDGRVRRVGSRKTGHWEVIE